MCVTPRDSKILPHLMTPQEIEDMFRTKHDEPETGDDETPREKPPLKPVRILEGMAASGLRAIRYARELDDVGRRVVVADGRVPRLAGVGLAADEGEREGSFEPQAPPGEDVPTQLV